jgi:Tol biopolymer transport system component
MYIMYALKLWTVFVSQNHETNLSVIYSFDSLAESSALSINLLLYKLNHSLAHTLNYRNTLIRSVSLTATVYRQTHWSTHNKRSLNYTFITSLQLTESLSESHSPRFSPCLTHYLIYWNSRTRTSPLNNTAILSLSDSLIHSNILTYRVAACLTHSLNRSLAILLLLTEPANDHITKPTTELPTNALTLR